LRLRISGTATAYIGYTEEAGENVVIRGVNSVANGEDYGPLWFDHVRYNVVRGVTVRDSVGFARLLDAHYNVIEDALFDGSQLYPGSSKRGGLYFAWSTNNKLLNSTINRGTDSLSLVRSDRNVIHGNTFTNAGHDVWNIKCGSFNVIRGNQITNPQQKLGSVFDCESNTTSWHGNGEFAESRVISDATHRNVIEGNVFHHSVDYYSTSGGNGIQYAGQNGIIRRNIFYANNVGLGMTQYPDEAQFNYGNRVYNNVFHDNDCSGISVVGTSSSGRVENNVYKNNALWDNKGWRPDGNCAGVSAAQLLYRQSLNGHLFQANLIASPLGSAVIGEEFGADGSLANFTGNGNFARTREADPRFTSAAAANYTAQTGSPLIDGGDFLTTARTGGSGRQIPLADASWFYDGFGIAGEQGDVVQLEGQTTTVRITRIDYTTNTVTVDRDLTWTAGQGIALSYTGPSPDIGVFER
jgi:parallel beta-helix repeat protein